MQAVAQIFFGLFKIQWRQDITGLGNILRTQGGELGEQAVEAGSASQQDGKGGLFRSALAGSLQ